MNPSHVRIDDNHKTLKVMENEGEGKVISLCTEYDFQII